MRPLPILYAAAGATLALEQAWAYGRSRAVCALVTPVVLHAIAFVLALICAVVTFAR